MGFPETRAIPYSRSTFGGRFVKSTTIASDSLSINQIDSADRLIFEVSPRATISAPRRRTSCSTGRSATTTRTRAVTRWASRAGSLPREPELLLREPEPLPREPGLLPREPNVLPSEPGLLLCELKVLPREPNRLAHELKVLVREPESQVRELTVPGSHGKSFNTRGKTFSSRGKDRWFA